MTSGKRLIGRFTEGALLKRAKEVVKEKSDAATIFNDEEEQAFAKFGRDELSVGRILGRGGFCVVSEIYKFTLKSGAASTPKGSVNAIQDEEEDEFGELKYDGGMVVQDRSFMERRCLRKGKHPRYAIKTLSDDVLNDPDRFVGGVIDLAVESRFLAVVRHPNIIKMRAMSTGNPYDRGFFVILDRLYDTLTLRITKWKREVGKTKGFGKIMDMRGKKKKKVWTNRILVVYDLSTALDYLHRQRIIYRDLKPDNVGFDVRGDVKIFDFGLARELPPNEKMIDGIYKMSGRTGSLRYMAPEVAKETAYNETVDVYSLAIMAWQIFAMETPFDGYSIAMHNDLVIQKGGRPKTDPAWGDRICNLLKRAWATDISARPSMKEFTVVMRKEVNDLESEIEDFSQLDASSRTANSL